MGRIRDLTGQKFGKLTAKYIDEEASRNNKRHQKVWVCDCDCGNEDIRVFSSNLVRGYTKSCGCYRRESRYKDLVGKTFFELKVISRGEDTTRKNSNGKDCFMRTWNCICSCGKTVDNVDEHNLKTGRIKSCGHIVTTKDPKYYPPIQIHTNTYDMSCDEYGIGYSLSGKPFYFDKEDYDLVKSITWNVKDDNYVEGVKDGEYYSLHRLVMGNPDCYVDHINHITNDNRKSNLRLANPVQNQSNRVLGKNNKSGVKGVYQSKSKWIAELTYNKVTHRKKFDTFDEAVKYRLYLEELYQKDFSYNNSINKNNGEGVA